MYHIWRRWTVRRFVCFIYVFLLLLLIDGDDVYRSRDAGPVRAALCFSSFFCKKAT